MRYRLSLPLILLAAVLSACGGDRDATAPTPGPPPPPPPPPPVPTVLLKDVVIPSLPSPYYHFEYDEAGRVSAASFASGLTIYAVTYDDRGRIKALQNNTAGNHDRLDYFYDDAGRVGAVKYVDASGQVYARVVLSYDGQQQLTGIERERRIDGRFVVEKTVALTYGADGNVLEIAEHRPHIDGRQDEQSTVDRYELYDDEINVDGFGLIHDDFFDHLVLLPGVRLQKGNPMRETRTGDGINYTVDYVYVYDESHRPLTKSGDVRLTNGADAGRHFQTRSEFSYY